MKLSSSITIVLSALLSTTLGAAIPEEAAAAPEVRADYRCLYSQQWNCNGYQLGAYYTNVGFLSTPLQDVY